MFHSKKVNLILFSNALNIAVAEGWILHTELHKNAASELTHLNFYSKVTFLLQVKPKFHTNSGPYAPRFQLHNNQISII